MSKFKTSAYVYKKVFNLFSNNNNNIITASKEIQQFLNSYGYKTKFITTTDYQSVKYSLSNLYGSCDFIVNDCGSLKDEDIGKLVYEIKNNNFYTWTPFQVSVYDSKNIKMPNLNSDFIYSLEESNNKKKEMILNFI